MLRVIHKPFCAECRYAGVVMLSVVMLSVAMLNVVAPEKGSASDFGRKMIGPNFEQNFD